MKKNPISYQPCSLWGTTPPHLSDISIGPRWDVFLACHPITTTYTGVCPTQHVDLKGVVHIRLCDLRTAFAILDNTKRIEP